MSPAAELAERLAGVLQPLLGAVRVDDLRRLSGGASRETWSFDAVASDGSARPLVLRRDPPGSARRGMALEAAAIAAAGAAGVPVPSVLAADDDPAALGSAFLVMDRVTGEALPQRLLRDEAYAAAMRGLTAECGRALAALHSVPVAAVPGLERTDELVRYRGLLDALGQPHPAFELGFRWLEENRPPPGPDAVVHGDFRLGNLLVAPAGLAAVLDWELVHAGDPMEDLGWLCVKSWRFNRPLPVGGFGTREALLEAYAAAGGRPDPAALHWWETLGTVKWGVMCIMQVSAHLSGALRSVELAAIGRRVCEVEHDVLLCLERVGAA